MDAPRTFGNAESAGKTPGISDMSATNAIRYGRWAMSNNFIGPKQRTIIEALKAGGELVQNQGQWRMRHDMGKSYFLDKRPCMALYTRGFLMCDGQASNGGFIYQLTEKGKLV